MVEGPIFAAASAAGVLLTSLLGRWVGGWRVALFALIVLGTQSALVSVLYESLAWAGPLLFLMQGITFLHFLAWFRGGPKPSLWRVGIALPASWFIAGTLLAFPWALAVALGFSPPLAWLPWAVSALGLRQSTSTRWEETDILIDRRSVGALARLEPGVLQPSPRPLRIVQISDPHLGTLMPVDRLRRICERAVAAEPDLILLTGDYLTVETNDCPGALVEALSPLARLSGRVFACRGNHDLESPEVVAWAMEQVGVRLLVDEAVVVETGAGRVQVLGHDFRFLDRAEKMAATNARFPRVPGVPRLVLLHDPGAFRHLGDGEADLAFAGHTHGGQVGLVSLGMKWTFVSQVSDIPDHGLWGQGRNRLYVHRGTGHYGFPLRLGVPAEEGVLRLHFRVPA